jgi:uncharacterized membrane protein (UPF0127 family)
MFEICLLALALGCAANPGCRQEPQGPPVVTLENAQGQEVQVRVEVAATSRERQQGLMHRKHLDPDAGMLFIYSFEDNHGFWMKETYVPLDIIFIGNNRRIVGIAENTKPLSLESIKVDSPSRFILEVNAGFTRKHGVREGSRVHFSGIGAGGLP